MQPGTSQPRQRVLLDLLDTFQVHIHRNLNYSDLIKLLERTAMSDHTKYDCFAMVFLSHGNQVRRRPSKPFFVMGWEY